MNDSAKKLLSLALAAAMTLSACGSTTENNGNSANENKSTASTTTKNTTTVTVQNENTITDLVLGQTFELNTFNLLYSQTSTNAYVLCNLWEGLLECDPNGKLQPCLAEEWGTEDSGLTWTFKIRDGLTWVDYQGNYKADLTAYDWATSLEWVLNFYKNDSHNTSMPMEMILGASEYYEYTKNLTQEEARALTSAEGSDFLNMVGIEIVDEHTIVYHCVSEKPYFESLALYNCLLPLSQSMVDELGIDGVQAMDNTTMWYNGAYLMDEYVSNNSKHLIQNPNYWDTESSRFETVSIYVLESNEMAYTLYQNGEIDYVDLTEAAIKTISDNQDNPYHDYMVELPATGHSMQFHFNYDNLNEDGSKDVNWNTAAANEAFRKAIYYGFDTTEYLRRINGINPLKCENEGFSINGLVYTSDDTDYADLVAANLDLGESNGETIARYNKELGEQYKTQAMEELSALGVTFPVEIDYYIQGSSQTALDDATVLKNSMEQQLGSDFITLTIKTYVNNFSQEARDTKLYALCINGWGADYGDPINYLGQMTLGNDNAWYSNYYAHINDIEENEATKELLSDYRTFTELVEKADAINGDLDARYTAFAEAEAYLIENCLAIPCNRKVTWCLTKINPYSKMNARYGSVNQKMKNWETNADGYTSEEINTYLTSK